MHVQMYIINITKGSPVFVIRQYQKEMPSITLFMHTLKVAIKELQKHNLNTI